MSKRKTQNSIVHSYSKDQIIIIGGETHEN